MLLASCHVLHVPSSNHLSSLFGQSRLAAPPTRQHPHWLRSGSADCIISKEKGKVVSKVEGKDVADMVPDRDAAADTVAVILS